MKKGTLLMIIGGGLLAVYLAVLYVMISPMYYGFFAWLQRIPLFIWGGFVAFTTGDIILVSFGLLFSVGVVTLVAGICLSVFRPRAGART